MLPYFERNAGKLETFNFRLLRPEFRASWMVVYVRLERHVQISTPYHDAFVYSVAWLIEALYVVHTPLVEIVGRDCHIPRERKTRTKYTKERTRK